MKAVIMIFGAILLIIFTPWVLDSLREFETDDYSADYIEATGASTSVDVALSQEVWGDETYNITVTSNLTEDAPVPISYTHATKVVTVSGLAENTSRRLTINYKIDALAPYVGAGVGAKMLPIVVLLGILGCIGGAIYTAVSREKD